MQYKLLEMVLDKGQTVVVDDNDVPHLTLKTDSEGGRIDVQDSSGTDSLRLNVNKENAGRISVLGANTNTVVGISSGGKDDGGLVAVSSGHAKDNENENTGPFTVLAALDNKAYVGAFSKTKNNYILLLAEDDGSVVKIKDDKNFETVLNSDSISIWNSKTDKPIVHSGIIDSGESYVASFDKNGKQV